MDAGGTRWDRAPDQREAPSGSAQPVQAHPTSFPGRLLDLWRSYLQAHLGVVPREACGR